MNIIEDIKNAWIHILVALSIAMISCMIIFGMMRWIAKPLILFSIIGVFIALGFGNFLSIQSFQNGANNTLLTFVPHVVGAYYCFAQYIHLKTHPVDDPNNENQNRKFSRIYFEIYGKPQLILWNLNILRCLTVLSRTTSSQTFWISFAILFSILFGIMAFIVCIIRTRISIATGLIEEGTK